MFHVRKVDIKLHKSSYRNNFEWNKHEQHNSNAFCSIKKRNAVTFSKFGQQHLSKVQNENLYKQKALETNSFFFHLIIFLLWLLLANCRLWLLTDSCCSHDWLMLSSDDVFFFFLSFTDNNAWYGTFQFLPSKLWKILSLVRGKWRRQISLLLFFIRSKNRNTLSNKLYETLIAYNLVNFDIYFMLTFWMYHNIFISAFIYLFLILASLFQMISFLLFKILKKNI